MPASSPDQNTKDTAAETVEVKAAETAQDVKATSEVPSSPEKGDKGDMLSAVKAALEPKTEATPGSDEQGSKSESDPTKDAEKEGDEAGDESDDLTEEELARLRPKTRKRIDNLLRDRSERDRKIAEIEPKAQQFEQVVRFVEDAGLTPQEVNQGFDVMAKLKNDPHAAYEIMKPIFHQLQQIVGDVLPEDLQQEVNLGRLTEAHARDLVRNRSAASVAAQQRQRDTDRQNQQRQQDDQRTRVHEASSAVSEWERSKEKSDPDWKLKSTRVTELLELEIVRRRQSDPGYFPTKAEAVQFATAAYEKVGNEFKAFAPRRREIRTDTDVASTLSTATPKNMLEAAKLALAGSTG